jgi:hypothetical protein
MKITKGIEVKPFTNAIHGINGVGKSTLASEFPDPIFIRLEDRLSHIDTNKTDLITTISAFQDALDWIEHEEHDFKTLNIDSVDNAENLNFENYAIKKGKTADNDYWSFGRRGDVAKEFMFNLTHQLDRIRANRKMHINLICHTITKKVSDPAGEDVERYNLLMADKAEKEVTKWADNILFLYSPSLTKKDGAKKKGIGNNVDRIIFTTPSPIYTAKNSFHFDTEIKYELGEGYNALLAQYKRWIKENKQNETV